MKKTLLTMATMCLVASTSLLADTPKEILDKSLNYMGSMQSYEFTAVSDHILFDKNKKIIDRYTNKYDASVKRPYKVRIDVQGETKYRENYFNNGVYTLYNKELAYKWGDKIIRQVFDID